VRRVLARVDPDALDRAIGAWLAARPPFPPTNPPLTRPPRRAVAVDGKTLRGSGHHGTAPTQLLAAMDHATGGILARPWWTARRMRPPGSGRCWSGCTSPAPSPRMRCTPQREHAEWLVTHKHADHI
jgi:hypothetical protein